LKGQRFVRVVQVIGAATWQQGAQEIVLFANPAIVRTNPSTKLHQEIAAAAGSRRSRPSAPGKTKG